MLNRHDLLLLTDEGKKYAAENLRLANGTPVEENAILARNLILYGAEGKEIPAIVRRKEFYEEKEEEIGVGFTSHFVVEETRLRIASVVFPSHVKEVFDPFTVLNRPFVRRTRALQALAAVQSSINDISIGVWGSAGLEIFTGLPYTNAFSDLDLLFGATTFSTLEKALNELKRAEIDFKIRIDAEIRLPQGWGISLKELVGGSEEILGKSLNDVDLLRRADVLDLLG